MNTEDPPAVDPWTYDPGEGKSVLHVLDKTGDTKQVWDSRNEAEVEVARAAFDSLTKKGYLAFSVKKDGSKGEVIREFDPKAEKIILSPPMQGG